MRAGKLDRRVRIERFTDTDDGYNTVQTWTPLADVACQYIPSAGKEAREALGQEATLPATFIVRWSATTASVGPADRLRFPAADDGRVFDIKSAVEPDRRQTIQILAIANDDGA